MALRLFYEMNPLSLASQLEVSFYCPILAKPKAGKAKKFSRGLWVKIGHLKLAHDDGKDSCHIQLSTRGFGSLALARKERCFIFISLSFLGGKERETYTLIMNEFRGIYYFNLLPPVSWASLSFGPWPLRESRSQGTRHLVGWDLFSLIWGGETRLSSSLVKPCSKSYHIVSSRGTSTWSMLPFS